MGFKLSNAVSFADSYNVVYKDDKQLLRSNDHAASMFEVIASHEDSVFQLEDIISVLEEKGYTPPPDLSFHDYFSQIIRYLVNVGVLEFHED